MMYYQYMICIYIDPLLIKFQAFTNIQTYIVLRKFTSAAREADTSRHKSVITTQIWFGNTLFYGWK